MSQHASGRIAGSCQRGVALITALLVVALATIVTATLAWDSYLNIRRTANLLNMDQAMLYASGAESWGVQVLNEDLQNGNPDHHFGEECAYLMPPLTVECGAITGGHDDMQGRSNINNLVDT